MNSTSSKPKSRGCSGCNLCRLVILESTELEVKRQQYKCRYIAVTENNIIIDICRIDGWGNVIKADDLGSKYKEIITKSNKKIINPSNKNRISLEKENYPDAELLLKISHTAIRYLFKSFSQLTESHDWRKKTISDIAKKPLRAQIFSSPRSQQASHFENFIKNPPINTTTIITSIRSNIEGIKYFVKSIRIECNNPTIRLIVQEAHRIIGNTYINKEIIFDNGAKTSSQFCFSILESNVVYNLISFNDLLNHIEVTSKQADSNDYLNLEYALNAIYMCYLANSDLKLTKDKKYKMITDAFTFLYIAQSEMENLQNFTQLQTASQMGKNNKGKIIF